MIFSRRILIFTAVFCFGSILARSQDKPIGYWESHLAYNIGVGVATDGNTLFTVCSGGFFTNNPSQNALDPYSKVNGMSDIGMQCVAYDMATSTAVLVYANGNIDLFKNNTFYNIPDFKIKKIAGSKTVSQAYCENGIAYLCTSVGILVIDLTAYDITENYQFIISNQNVPINGFTGSGDYFYAITQNGVYRASKNSPQLQNFQVWQSIDSTHHFLNIASQNNTLFLSDNHSVYAFTGDSIKVVYTAAKTGNDSGGVQHIDAGITGLLISEFHPKTYNGRVWVMDTTFRIIDSLHNVGDPVQAVQLLDKSIWVADSYYGLDHGSANDVQIPDGPDNPNASDIYAYNRNVWTVHGVLDDKLDANGETQTASNLVNGKWVEYERFVFPCFNNVVDAVAIIKDEITGNVYVGSYENGLQIIKADGTCQQVDNLKIFDPTRALSADNRQITGLALDQYDNLWVTEGFAANEHPLYVRAAKDSSWHSFYIPISVLNGGPVLVDDHGLTWFVSYYTGGAPGGVIAYNANNTFNDPSDDMYFHLTTGAGNGNLPSNNVFCIAKDKNNSIWIGTDNGIGIVSNCSLSATQGSICDAVVPIVQYDQFAGYLFSGNNVRTIAVDGANRKWVGTDNGVWLLSSNAASIIYRFTVDNSPLPSNNIQKISIDPVTGDVYIGTDLGLVTYRSTATDTSSAVSSVTIFPNPVPKGYTGTIAIKGLSANADVRITDINDQLVYRTTALGGQAVWSGKDYKGHRPESGVYLVFASSTDGSQTYAGKIVFIH